MSFLRTTLTGTGAERGAQLGRQQGHSLGHWLAAWLGGIERAGIAEPRRYIASFLAETDHLTAIERHTPDLLDEVRSAAASAALPTDLYFAAQLMDEEWNFRRDTLAQNPPDKCSSFAIRASAGTTWVGQNMDLDASTDGFQHMVEVHPRGGSAALLFTVGGMVGLLGVNADGVAVCVNSLFELTSRRSGLPVAFLIRALLGAGSVYHAAQLVRDLPHATSQHYLLASAAEIRSFEASAEAVVEYHPPDAARLFHTNHALATPGSGEVDRLADSTARLAQLTARLSGATVELAAIQAAFSSCDPDFPICKSGDRKGGIPGDTIGFTTGSMVSALRQPSDVIDSWASAGPPAIRPYARFQLAAADAAPGPEA